MPLYRSAFGLATILLLLMVGAVWAANVSIYLPIVRIDATPTATLPPPTPVPQPTPSPQPTLRELRGIWVTRFEWTSAANPATAAKIEQMVDEIADAGFNAIFFQVRGTGDAFYESNLEPWSVRLSGELGKAPEPYWDPLATMIAAAHARGVDVHAYLNVYPVWDCISPLPEASQLPQHIYHQLRNRYGTTWNDADQVATVDAIQLATDHRSQCLGHYQRASPASFLHDEHFVRVAIDIADRYAIDGLHIDHIRYGSSASSCDPVSLCRYSGEGEMCTPTPSCEMTDDYSNWQRQQVNGTVFKLFNDLSAKHPDLWVSAAVWPIHIDHWGWSSLEGYHDYYQDSKAWLSGGYIDSIMPMIYSNKSPCTAGVADNETGIFFTRNRWETLVRDFQKDRFSGHIVAGIGGNFCDFEEIAWRIARSREIGAAGHAIFSYSHLKSRGFMDDLASGPYATPALPPLPPARR